MTFLYIFKHCSLTLFIASWINQSYACFQEFLLTQHEIIVALEFSSTAQIRWSKKGPFQVVPRMDDVEVKRQTLRHFYTTITKNFGSVYLAHKCEFTTCNSYSLFCQSPLFSGIKTSKLEIHNGLTIQRVNICTVGSQIFEAKKNFGVASLLLFLAHWALKLFPSKKDFNLNLIVLCTVFAKFPQKSHFQITQRNEQFW